MQVGSGLPVFSAILGAEQVARLLIFHAPGCGIHVLRILWIDGDVVNYVVIAAAQMGKPRPIVSAIIRDEKCSGAGAQKDVIRVLRIVGQAAHVAAIGTQRSPLAGPKGSCTKQNNRHKQQ